MNVTNRLRLGLLGLFVCLYLLPLGVRPLMEPDETRYAEIPREMLLTGNWVAPHLNGLRYFEKPPLGYWANAVAMRLLGENVFAVRLPSALSVGVSALALYLLCRRYCRSDETWVGPAASLILLTSVEVAAVGTFSVLDSMLACALTLALAAFFVATQATRGSASQRLWLVAAGVCCGLAFLLKGFLALVVPGLSVGAFLLWERRWRDIPRLAWLPLLSALLTALPWALAIHRLEPDFWHYFFWVEHVKRFLGGGGAQHPQPFWFFLAYGPLLILPWGFLLPAAVLGLRRSNPPAPDERRLIRFCLCWFGLPFLFFSLSSGKLLTYILPCWPPLAILLSLGLTAGLRADRRLAFHLGAGLTAGLFALLAAALLVVQTVGLAKVPPPYSAPWQWLAGFFGLAAFAALPLLALRAREAGTKLILIALSPVPLLMLAPFILPAKNIEIKSPNVFLDRYRAEITADTHILSDEDPLRAVCWAFKRRDILVVGSGGELDYGLAYPDARDRLLNLDQARALIQANPGKVVLVAHSRSYRHWQDRLPPPTKLDSSGPDGYILAKY